MPKYDYDLITLGAGSGGVRASRLAGGYGARVAVVEQSRVGGTCVMRGCVPKKLLVTGAHYAEDFHDARGFGWRIGEVGFDWPSLIDGKNVELNRLEGVYQRILRDNKVELIEGAGRIVDPHTVAVGGRTLTSEKILLATGGRATLPAIPGIEHAITSDQALELRRLPGRMVIVGGGYIAVEFAGIFRALGSEVVEIIRADNVLRGFDEDVRTHLASEMEKKGIVIRRGGSVRSIATAAERPIATAAERSIATAAERSIATAAERSIATAADGYTLTLSTGEELPADVILYATGRSPNTRGIGLEEAGVSLGDKGAVIVDEWNRSSVDSIFAVGDCTDRINLTPVAIAEGRAFSETHFNSNPIKVDYENVASAVFSQPPVATVGLTEARARARGPVKIFLTRFKGMKHTLSGRDERTLMKLVVDKVTDRVLGCHMVGADAPEIIQGLAIALKCGATKAQFDATVGIHPTAAEEFVTLRDPVPEPT